MQIGGRLRSDRPLLAELEGSEVCAPFVFHAALVVPAVAFRRSLQKKQLVISVGGLATTLQLHKYIL